jgi:hypothetical protein
LSSFAGAGGLPFSGGFFYDYSTCFGERLALGVQTQARSAIFTA